MLFCKLHICRPELRQAIDGVNSNGRIATLQFRHASLTHVPDFINTNKYLKKIKVLNIHWNQIYQLPDWFKDFTTLNTLILTGTMVGLDGITPDTISAFRVHFQHFPNTLNQLAAIKNIKQI